MIKDIIEEIIDYVVVIFCAFIASNVAAIPATAVIYGFCAFLFNYYISFTVIIKIWLCICGLYMFMLFLEDTMRL